LKPNAEKPHHSAETIGIAAALAAYSLWGLAPIYFKQIVSVAPLEVIAHRILWSVPLLAGFLWWRKGSAFLAAMRLPRRTVLVLLGSGMLVAFNWLIFVWAVMNNQVLATSLGYFTGPLVNFMLGFLFLKERLTPVQTAGVLIAAAGTVYLGWFLGTPPWISLSLAFSFGAYGLIRKMLGVTPMVGLLWETLLLALPALLFIAWAGKNGTLAFTNDGLKIDLLLILAGPVTVLPLVWFNVACRALRLSTVGFFQYIAPSLTFLLSVFVYGETFTRGHAVAFSCIWFALLMVSVETVIRSRRIRSSRGREGVAF